MQTCMYDDDDDMIGFGRGANEREDGDGVFAWNMGGGTTDRARENVGKSRQVF